MLQGSEDPATKILVSWIGVIGAVSAALISIAGVVFNVLYTRRNHKESLRLQRELSDRAADLQRDLSDRSANLAANIETGKAFFNEELEERKQTFEREMAQKKADFDSETARKKAEFDRQLEVDKQLFLKELEAIKSGFDDANAERRARRDYEYEARKRIYKDIEPLLFQLIERAEGAGSRISSLARWTKEGNLCPDGGWLSDPNDYHALLNMYSLIAPLTVIKLIQQKLTAADLGLVPRINDLYAVARVLYWSFTDHFFIQEITNLPYDPNHAGWAELRKKQPSVYWRQGIPVGKLDKAVEILIEQKTGQCISFGSFEAEFKREKSEVNESFEIIFDTFRDFHPQTRPILWRILLIQAYLYYTLYVNRDQRDSSDGKSNLVTPSVSVLAFVEENFDWRQSNDQVVEDEVFAQPANTAETYLQKRLKILFAESNASTAQHELAP